MSKMSPVSGRFSARADIAQILSGESLGNVQTCWGAAHGMESLKR